MTISLLLGWRPVRQSLFLVMIWGVLGLLFSFMGVSHSMAKDVVKLSGGLASPVGMAFAKDGSLYISNWSANRIDKWADGALTAWVKNVDAPTGLAIDEAGRLYVASYSSGVILRFDEKKNVETFTDGLSVVAGISFDRRGNLLVCERGRSQVLRITPDKQKTVLVDSGLQTPVGVVDIGEGRFIIADITGSIFVYNEETKELHTLTTEPSAPAIGLVFDEEDNIIYSPDYGAKGIFRIELEKPSSTILAKDIRSPVALAEKDGVLYVGSWSDNALYMVFP